MATSGGSNKQGSKTGSKQSDTSNRGFASMDPDRQREIASEGGRAAHEKGTAHEFTPEEARKAGSQSHKNDGNRNDGNRQGSDAATRDNATRDNASSPATPRKPKGGA